MAQPKAITTQITDAMEAPALFNRLLALAQKSISQEDLIARVIQPLGQVLRMDRVYVFSLRNEGDKWFASQLDEWVANGIKSELHNPELQELDMAEMMEVVSELMQSKLYFRVVDSHPDPLIREFLQAQAIKSIMIAPIFVQEKMWGFIGFDDCSIAREWSTLERDLIQASARLLSMRLETLQVHNQQKQLDQQLEIAIESSKDGIWTLHIQENRLDFSEEWCGLLGYSMEDTIPSIAWLEQLIHPQDRQEFLNQLDPYRPSQLNMLSTEYRIRAKNGAYRWFQTQATIKRDEFAMPTVLIASNFDITARTTFKTSLEQKEAEYQQLVESIEDVVFRIDHHQRWAFLNNAWTQITGFDVSNSIGRTALDFVYPDDRDRIEQRVFLDKDHNAEDNLSLEFRLLTLKGGFRWVKLMGQVRVIDDRRIVGISGTLTNIHERKQAEMALRESEERFRLMSENMSELVCLHDTTGCLSYVSPSCELVLGYKREDMEGRDPGELMSAEDRDRLTFNILHPMIQGNLVNDTIQVQLYKADGSKLWVETVVQPILQDGELKALLSVSRDISARKRVEQEMAKALEKEKELNKLRTTFITMASHEFRTPMASIKSSVDIMEMYVEESTPILQKPFNRHFEKIRLQIDRLTNMMNDVLILGRTEAEKMPFKPESIDLVQFCMEFIEQNFLNRTDGRTVNISVKGKRCHVELDPSLFGHILSNLLSNAFKYSLDGGNPRLKIDFQEKDVMLCVEDDGIGIPKAEQDQLFHSFFRAENAMNLEGTGLGLVIVKQFIEMHGGEVSINSEEGKGTEVCILVPHTQK